MPSLVSDFISFITKSPTAFHAAKEIRLKMAETDFIPLEDHQSLQRGSSYFSSAPHATTAAFHLPKRSPKRAIILASHIDSPSLKIKPHPDFSSKGGKKLGVELYGSPLLNTWTNRDLGFGGKVVYREGNKIKSMLIDVNEAPLIIPQLAIHFNKKANEEGVVLNKQTQLCPLFSLNDDEEKPFKSYLESLFPKGNILDFDLFLYPLEAPRLIGKEREMLASYRLDNLASAHGALQSLVEVDQEDLSELVLGVFYDHEEIGSMTSTGAFSPFVMRLLERIFSTYSTSKEEFYNFLSSSLCLSLDVAFGLDPNYVDRYDEENSPKLGKGIAVKYHGMKRYATASRTAALITATCEDHKIPCQKFNMRSDLSSGTTIGPIFESTTGIETVDLGIPCLSMHAAREIISVKDLETQARLLKEIIRCPLDIEQGSV